MGWQRKHLIRLALIIAGFAVFAACVVFMGTSPREKLANVFGVAETAFAPSRRGWSEMTIKLDNGTKVVVTLPRGRPYIPGARVELEVTAIGSGDTRLYLYDFAGYRDKDGRPLQ